MHNLCSHSLPLRAPGSGGVRMKPSLLYPLESRCADHVHAAGPFLVLRYGWFRWVVFGRGEDGLYRWTGPKPMWSRLQAVRVADALLKAWNDSYDLTKRRDARLSRYDLAMPASSTRATE